MGRLIPNTFNLGIVIFVAIGSTCCSYGMSVISSTIGQPSFYTHFHLATEGTPGYSRTSNLIGAANGLNCAGSAFGAALTAWTADRFGRRVGIQLGAVISIVGAILCAASVDMGMFLVSRFIAGVGVGILISGIPMCVTGPKF